MRLSGFSHNEETNLYSRTEFKIRYSMPGDIGSDFEYYVDRERSRGNLNPTLADFAANHYRKEQILITPLPEDGEDSPFVTDILQRDFKKKNYLNMLPLISEAFNPDARKKHYQVLENRVFYNGNTVMGDSIRQYYQQEIVFNDRLENPPTMKEWYESLSALQRNAMELSKQSLEVLM